MRLTLALLICLFVCSCTLEFRVDSTYFDKDTRSWNSEVTREFVISFFQSRSKSSFVDTDGTNFDTVLSLAPASKLTDKAGQMQYSWGVEKGSIGVGESVTGLDQTGQSQVIEGFARGAVEGALGFMNLRASQNESQYDLRLRKAELEAELRRLLMEKSRIESTIQPIPKEGGP